MIGKNRHYRNSKFTITNASANFDDQPPYELNESSTQPKQESEKVSGKTTTMIKTIQHKMHQLA